MFVRIEHPGYGRFLTASSPLAFGAMPRPDPMPAPRFGDQTTQVLREVLALEPDAIDALRSAGVVAGPSGASADVPAAPTN